MRIWNTRKQDVKEVVENYSSVSIFELHKHSASDERHISLGHGSFNLGDTRMRFARDNGGYYLELVGAPPGTGMTAINLVTSKCHYGGRREWFECDGCKKRVGILYRTKEYEFRCRHCLDLRYQSQKRNYRGFGPMIHRYSKYREMEPIWGRQFYQGKVTKRADRYWKFRQRVEWEMDIFAKFQTRKAKLEI